MSLFLPSSRETQLADALQRAANEDVLDLHIQPIVSLETGAIDGWESLLRYTHPKLGPITPAEFIPIAERTGSIVDLGRWVIRQACSWRATVDVDGAVAVNISARQLVDRRFLSMIFDTLDAMDLDGAALCLELTETAILDDVGHAATVLERLRERGVAVALDDFGTGFASLSVLRDLPVNIVKIDRSYVQTAGQGGREDAFLAGVIGLSERVGARVVVEGIERAAQLEAVRTFGATWGQGYLLGAPRAASTTISPSELELASAGALSAAGRGFGAPQISPR